MLLGGIYYLLPVIKAAHEQGYYVITADYLPDNVAHQYSDEYVNVSIINKEEVLRVAQVKEIDGIISFGVDPGVVTAAYVQEKMGLPSMGPYESVCILQNKDLFRAFLAEHGFNTPFSQGFSSKEDVLKCPWIFNALSSNKDQQNIGFPLIIKPTDSAGSKGVTKITKYNELERAIDNAFEFSISKRIIVEEFIEKDGCSSDSDCFSIDGKLVFASYSSQYFDEESKNPYVPAAFCWPSTFSKNQELFLTQELQRLLSLLHMRTSLYNFETRIGQNGKAYIMELSPRGGGNRLSEMLKFLSGIDLIKCQVCAAVGDPIPETFPCNPIAHYTGNWVEVVLHSATSGIFQKVEYSNWLQDAIVDISLYKNRGDYIEAFSAANSAIGSIILNFKSLIQKEQLLKNIRNSIKIIKT